MLDETQVRQEKLEKLRSAGMDPYPSTSHRDTSCQEAIERFDDWSREEKAIVLAGRVLTTRIHGGILFADLMDETGKIQLVLKRSEGGGNDARLFDSFQNLVDPGDIVEARGSLFLTKRGEKSLLVSSWALLSKALLSLPEKWHGLQDIEMRYRERELDLLSNPAVRERFRVRSRLISALRHFLDEQGFLEVETPVLHPIPGGANARPFCTHHNALNIDLYLRIAPELYLKRLLVGGFEKVYEMGRCFRNEGMDYSHNPEFTMMEMYWAYVEKETYFAFVEKMMTHVLEQVLGTLNIPHEAGAMNFSLPWPRTTFREAVLKASGIDVNSCDSIRDVERAVKKQHLRVDFSTCIGKGEYLDQLYKKTARPEIRGPIWIFDYPIEMIPLAKHSLDDPTKSAMAQLVIHGVEVIKVFYHELNDPGEQRARFEAEQELAEKGSEEAQRLDETFLRSLEHGMPPASGLGIGIDRLAAFLTNSPNLKEVILFPTLRPEPSRLGQEEGPKAQAQ